MGFIYLISNLLILAYMVQGEMFSAIVDLAHSSYAEGSLVKEIHEHLKSEERRLKSIKQLLMEIEEDTKRLDGKQSLEDGQSSQAEIEDYFANPVDAYKKISHLVLDLRPRLMRAIYGDVEPTEESSSTELLLALQSESGSLIKSNSSVMRLKGLIDKLPDIDDLNGAIDAFFRLQDTYKLNTRLLALGKTQSSMQSSALKAFECFGLGHYASKSQDFYHAAMWLTEALYQYDREERENIPHYGGVMRRKIDRLVILDYLVYAVYRQSNVCFMPEIDPGYERALRNKPVFESLLERDSRPGQYRKGEQTGQEELDDLLNSNSAPNHTLEFDLYEALCRGERLATQTAEQYCRYYVPHVYFTYAPIKEMIVSKEAPHLVVWYDLISQSEIHHIKHISAPKLNRATVRDSHTGEMKAADYRISKSAWLEDDTDEITKRINKRIEMVTGLDLSSAEILQVVNYGLGGQYEPHFDHSQDSDSDAFDEDGGNRIATLIFYLTDVKGGGSTVFPELNAKLDPERGSAAFWYNLKRNGRSETRTLHAACPVLFGSKWVMNKWFHVQGQEMIRPCTNNPLE
ncbi:Prolyl 4-hydroxylase, alpha polypeptide [Cichlidogyrus casuarinus]|uniref:procollagen-proline 4-dioxygenase n=1 Tax=Cichlidogyrus casuarinus TaxID=1844966 RepID=A0ABD2QEM2_9PLAT